LIYVAALSTFKARSGDFMSVSADAYTPSGLQTRASLHLRRLITLCVTSALYGALVVWLDHILSAGGWDIFGVLILICFAIAAPWTVLGVWNSCLGFWLIHFKRNGISDAAPFVGEDDNSPLTSTTAVIMTLRNEDPARAFARLRCVMESLIASGHADHFSFFVLSDSTDHAISAQEEDAFRQWQAWAGAHSDRLYHRRRSSNEGFKAGNIRDFCARWGDDYDFMLPLDADSLMSGPAIVSLVRMAQAHPRIGIIQSLVVGAPSSSLFARLFQFGMRHGMRSYTMGNAWWSGDCGPFWGHNALVRIAPFKAHCDLPLIDAPTPLGGAILSHDQVEAVLMRRAGYEVRVVPLEGQSYEDNPPDVLEFARRDIRWCQGNMQYLFLLGMKNVLPMSRFQLIWAIMMFIGVPAWTLILLLIALKAAWGLNVAPAQIISAQIFYITFLVLSLMPKIMGWLDCIRTAGATQRYGGPLLFGLNVISEIIFSFCVGSCVSFGTGLFLIGLAFGRSITWNGQKRDALGLSWRQAFRALWPASLFGLVLYALAFWHGYALIVWSLPLTLGYVLAIPFAVITAAPQAGRWAAQRGWGGIPEDFDPPAIIRALTPAQ
jgi:membrane glycosyltransferase